MITAGTSLMLSPFNNAPMKNSHAFCESKWQSYKFRSLSNAILFLFIGRDAIFGIKKFTAVIVAKESSCEYLQTYSDRYREAYVM